MHELAAINSTNREDMEYRFFTSTITNSTAKTYNKQMYEKLYSKINQPHPINNI